MERRSFLKAAMAGSCMVGASSSAVAQPSGPGRARGPQRDHYELRTYTLKNKEQQAQVEAYLEKAAIPAMNRMGIETVGVFTEMKPSEKPKLYVLIVYPSLREFFMILRGGLLEDDALQKDGAAYLNTPKDAPAYERIQSSFMAAFEHMPRVKIPEKKPRIFELRQYESHNETKAKKKIEMFNSAEMDIFLKTGVIPVFFGEMIIGENIPNLTYMVTFDDMEDHAKDWKSFFDSPEWNELKVKEEYRDTVSHITQTFLVPTSYSQI